MAHLQQALHHHESGLRGLIEAERVENDARLRLFKLKRESFEELRAGLAVLQRKPG